MGAIVDPTQRKSIDTYVQQAKQDGAEVYQACACMPSHGCFYPPTLITKVEPVSVCVQEEVGDLIMGLEELFSEYKAWYFSSFN